MQASRVGSMPLQQGSLSSQGRAAGFDHQQCVWRSVRACRRSDLSSVRRCRVCAIRLRISPLRGRVPHHWFLQGSPKKGVERKDRLYEAQHRPCRVVSSGTGNGCAGQHRLQEGRVTSPCVLAYLARTRKIQRYPFGNRRVLWARWCVTSGYHPAPIADDLTFAIEPPKEPDVVETDQEVLT